MTQDKEQSALPVVSDSGLEGHLGEAAVDLAVTKMGFIFHNQTGADYDETSDLTLASEELRKLTETGKTDGPARRAVLLLPFDENEGITTSDEELGLACLELAKARRCVAPSIEVEVVGQADLVASIDAIRDLAAPTPDRRREALMRETILDRYERKAAQLKRAFTWFLTDPSFLDSLA